VQKKLIIEIRIKLKIYRQNKLIMIRFIKLKSVT